MRIIYSAHNLGELKEAIEKEGGISFKFDVNDAFVDMIKKAKEADDCDVDYDAVVAMGNNLVRLASKLSISLNHMIDDGYSVPDFVIQSDLLGKILSFLDTGSEALNEE